MEYSLLHRVDKNIILSSLLKARRNFRQTAKNERQNQHKVINDALSVSYYTYYLELAPLPLLHSIGFL